MNYLRFFRNISTQYLLQFSHEFSHKSNYPSMILHDAPEKKSRVLMNVNSFLEYFVRRTNQQTKVEPGGGKRMRSVSANRFLTKTNLLQSAFITDDSLYTHQTRVSKSNSKPYLIFQEVYIHFYQVFNLQKNGVFLKIF